MVALESHTGVWGRGDRLHRLDLGCIGIWPEFVAGGCDRWRGNGGESWRDTFAQSVEVGCNSVINDLYAYRLTGNKWTTFIMVTQDNKREFLGC